MSFKLLYTLLSLGLISLFSCSDSSYNSFDECSSTSHLPDGSTICIKSNINSPLYQASTILNPSKKNDNNQIEEEDNILIIKDKDSVKNLIDNLTHVDKINEDQYISDLNKNEYDNAPQILWKPFDIYSFLKRLAVYKVLNHYEDNIELFLEKHPKVKATLEQVEVTDKTVKVYLLKKDF
ncbi:MAG: hypothetical protein ACR2M7_00265 [Bdellovibrionales bacterium]